MHISSLPSEYGIGTLGKEAYDFVDFLKETGQRYWQVLPIGPTSYGDSPYQSFSSYAGNPYFIDLDFLVNQGLLSKNDIEKLKWGSNLEYIDYGTLYNSRFKVLKIAYQNRTEEVKKRVKDFENINSNWLQEYSFYMSIKNFYSGVSWTNWPKSIKLRTKKAFKDYKDLLKEEISFWNFVQCMFFEQWYELKEYANKSGIKIIGDIPIYCAYDSADVWANKENFKLDDEGNLITVSGCPPDDFSEDGQLWGNPIYNWEYIKSDNYRYWVDKIKYSSSIYDVVRIDHFRGFEAFWEVQYGAENAVKGKWVKGPDIDLFNSIKDQLGEVNIIAEDLGYLTEEVFELLDATGFPGMNVLQFAFDGDEDNKYLPSNQKENSIVYTGTHDNKTLLQWVEDELTEERDEQIRALSELGEEEEINKVLIDIAYNSPANIAIIPIQDILVIGKEGRMNEPSTLGKNWTWRMKRDVITDEIKSNLYDAIKSSNRL